MALLTSSFTMDAQRSTSRAYIARFGRLLGAVRLPSGAFSRVAGTDVVTDLLILRRHTSGDAATIAQDHWLGTRPVEVDGQVTDKAMTKYGAEWEPGSATCEYPNGQRAPDSPAISGCGSKSRSR